MADPAWSPDGTVLAVSSWAGEHTNVYTMKADGTERKLVLENAYSPSWSPDGKRLVVVREGSLDVDSVNALAIVNADGSDARTLELVAAEDAEFLDVSRVVPDGKLIAFVAVDEDSATIELVSPEGKAASMPKVEANGETGLSWSPDSTSLAFDRYVETKDGGHLAAVVLDLATGRETVYAGEQLGAQSPTWSPEGDVLAFISTSMRAESTTTTDDLALVRRRGLRVAALGDVTEWHEGAQAGRGRVPGNPELGACIRGRPRARRRWRMSSRQRQRRWQSKSRPRRPTSPRRPRSTTSKPALTSRPTPAPLEEDRAAVCSQGPHRRPRLERRSTSSIPTTRRRTRCPDTADMIAPAWSPDGSLLAVERVQEAGVSSIYTIRPDGTQPQLVLKNASTPSWSADGRPDLRRPQRVLDDLRAGRRPGERPLQRPARRRRPTARRFRTGRCSRPAGARLARRREPALVLRRRERGRARDIRHFRGGLVAGRNADRLHRRARPERRRSLRGHRHCRPLDRVRRGRHAAAPPEGRLRLAVLALRRPVGGSARR